MKYLLYNLIALTSLNLINAQENHSFLNPPNILKGEILLSDNYSRENRKFSGIPSFAITKEGIMWADWYAGKTASEDQNNYVVVASSYDEGQTWKEAMIIDPDGDGDVRAFDPELWIDPTGRLWVFWAQSIGHNGTQSGVWTITTDNPGSAIPEWSEPRRLTDGIMMCKPLVLRTGEWVLPASTWKDTDNSARMIISEDEGKNWIERGAANIPDNVQTFDEHMIVERKDSSLWMLVRTRYGIGESVSKDRGHTWTTVQPSAIMHPSARFFITKLESDDLLLVKHGPIYMKTGRSHLMAFISKDDGKTWSDGLLIDQRPGVSYPDGQQTEDGTIHIIYDYNRTKEQAIYLTSFTPENILSQKKDEALIRIYKNRKLISNK